MEAGQHSRLFAQHNHETNITSLRPLKREGLSLQCVLVTREAGIQTSLSMSAARQAHALPTTRCKVKHEFIQELAHHEGFIVYLSMKQPGSHHGRRGEPEGRRCQSQG